MSGGPQISGAAAHPGRPAEQIADLAVAAYAAGSTTNVLLSPAAYTVGTRWFATSARILYGIRFFHRTSATYSETVRCCAWNAAGSRFGDTTVAVGLPIAGTGGVISPTVAQVALFASPLVIPANTRFQVSVYRRDLAEYVYSTSTLLNTLPLRRSPLTAPPYNVGDGLVLEGYVLGGGGGDILPDTVTAPSSELHLVGPLLDGMPYTETPCVTGPGMFVFDGDSIAASAAPLTEVQTYPHLVSTALGRPYVNVAHPGDTLANILARISTTSGRYAAAGATTLIGEGCVNDFNTGSTAAQAYAALQTLVAAYRAAGFVKVAWLTQYATTYNNVGPQELAFNALVRQNTGGLLDLTIDVANGPAVTLQSDGLHADVPGQLTMQGVVQAALVAAGW